MIPNVTQQAHPWRATARTIVAALFGLVLILPEIIEAVGVSTAVPVVAALLTASGVVTRLLAVPSVNAWLSRYRVLEWLAAAPAEPLEERED